MVYRVQVETLSIEKVREFLDSSSTFSQRFYSRTSSSASYGKFLKFSAIALSPDLTYHFTFTCDIDESGLPDKTARRVLFPSKNLDVDEDKC